MEKNCEICEWLNKREKSARVNSTPLHPVLQERIAHRQQFHPKEKE